MTVLYTGYIDSIKSSLQFHKKTFLYLKRQIDRPFRDFFLFCLIVMNALYTYFTAVKYWHEAY
jgi:hypothetical protein